MLPKVVRCDELPPKVELNVNVNEVSGPGTESRYFRQASCYQHAVFSVSKGPACFCGPGRCAISNYA